MNTYVTSLFDNHVPLPVSTNRRRHPFLVALEQIKHGRLNLITPENGKLEFSGNEAGPAAHLKLYDWRVLDDFLARGEMGFADAYIKGRWASENLIELLTFGLMNASSLEKFFYGKKWYVFLTYLRQMLRVNSLWGSRRNVMAHYDLGNDFYRLWLDEGMTYSCALFEGDPNRTLEAAQAAKYARILRKLGAAPGEHILEIGCGWGGFAEAAARQGFRVTAITLSEEQASYAQARLYDVGLQHLAHIELMDYRKLSGSFDHIVSIGMFEHVGERYWPTYFDAIKKCLKPGGTAMIQSITLDEETFQKYHHYSGFMEQVIFPGGMLPSKSRFAKEAGQAGLSCHELFFFGKDYALTTQEWLKRFNLRKEEVKALGYDDAFLRLWRFYLSANIAAFKSGRTDVMQAKLANAA